MPRESELLPGRPDPIVQLAPHVVNGHALTPPYPDGFEIAEKDLSHVGEDSPITDLGIDSLAMLELVGSMERELRIRVPDESLVGLQTVRQLLELVEGRLPQPA